MKLWLLYVCIGGLGLVSSVFGQNTSNNFFIIPDETDTEKVIEAVRSVSTGSGTVWDRYNKEASSLSGNLGNQFASGIMTWDTLIQYIIYLVRFINQIALVIGAVMIVYAGYIYATGIFSASGDGASAGNSALKYAIAGIVVVASAYAIIRILTSAFLS